MTVQKIKSGRIITVQASTYVGDKGTIFYDEDVPELRLSDGNTPGGIIISSGGSAVLVTATNTRLGGIKVGENLAITGDGTLSVNTQTLGLFLAFGNLDGGYPDSIYGGTQLFDGGGV